MEGTPELDCMALSTLGLTSLSLIHIGFRNGDHLPPTLLDLHLEDSQPLPPPGLLTPIVRRLPALTSLRLDGLPFANPPSGISCLTSMRQLGIYNNPELATLGYIGGLHRLERLTVHGCPALEGLPASLSGLIGLHTLRIVDTSLPYVSPALSALPALRCLTLGGTLLSLPAGLGALTGVEQLSLRYCHKLVDVGAMAGMTRLTHLEMGGCVAVSSLPPMPALLVLNLNATGWGVRQLPPLPSLVELEMHGCALERLPTRLSTLTTLRRLRINYNRQLPVSELEGLSALACLTRLECQSCDFTVVPSWVAAAGVSCDLPIAEAHT